jgi:predicted XRE-type DNA-binding protein
MIPLSNERDMTPDEFRQWYDRLGLKQADLAKRLDVDQPRISKWLRGEIKISGYLWRALAHLEAELAEERRSKRRQPPANQ